MEATRNETDSTVKYPDCVVQLVGVDPNAVAVFRKVRKELIRHLVDTGQMSRPEAEAKGDEFQTEATAGDYDHVFATCYRWVTVI